MAVVVVLVFRSECWTHSPRAISSHWESLAYCFLVIRLLVQS